MYSLVSDGLPVPDEQPFAQIRDLPGSSCSSFARLPTGLESISQERPSRRRLCNSVPFPPPTPFPPQALHTHTLGAGTHTPPCASK